MYDLSFSEEFFTGNEGDLYDMEPSDTPTNIYQAIISLPKKVQIEIAREVMRSLHPVLYVQSESFPFDVLEKVRETNLCDGLESPVQVYIDPEQYYSLMIYED